MRNDDDDDETVDVLSSRDDDDKGTKAFPPAPKLRAIVIARSLILLIVISAVFSVAFLVDYYQVQYEAKGTLFFDLRPSSTEISWLVCLICQFFQKNRRRKTSAVTSDGQTEHL